MDFLTLHEYQSFESFKIYHVHLLNTGTSV